jgi:predicted phosphodiesterase
MRYLVFGDVHGNLVALEAVLAAAQARGVEAYLFTGDLIGYGPDPLGCVERLMALQATGAFAWVAGNHEMALRGEFDPGNYNEEAARTLKWTGRLLAENPAAVEFLNAGEQTVQVNDQIFLTHDSLADPGSGRYHRDTRKAKAELACLRYRQGRVCFYGHTHTIRAEFARADGEIVLPLMEPHTGQGYDPHPVRLGPDEIGWVGAGSVGFPGNEKRWPECLIVDDREWHIEKYAVEYDRQAARTRAREVLGLACGDAIAEHIARWM